MKKYLIVVLLMMSAFVLAACGPDLPAEPGAPGEVKGALAGKGYDYGGADGVDYGAGGDLFATPDEFFSIDGTFITRDCIPNTLTVVYDTAYCANEDDPTWNSIPMEGTPIADSPWLSCGASIDCSGYDACLVYYCSRTGSNPWECNGNRWVMIECPPPPECEQGFLLIGEACVPTCPEGESLVNGQCVQPCAEQSDCLAPQFCDIDEGICVQLPDAPILPPVAEDSGDV